MAIMSPQDQCNKILAQVHASQLHFLVQESPFSLYLTVRKKFTQKIPKSTGGKETVDTSACDNLQTSELKLKEARDIIKILEDKI